jgi:hypothetical protein
MTAAQRRREFQEAVKIDDFLREQAADHTATAPGPPRPEGGGEVEAGTGTPPGPEPSPLVGHLASKLKSRR